MYTSVMAFDVFVRTGVSIKSFGFRALGLVTVLVQRTLMVHLPKEYWIQYRNYFIALFRTLRLFVFLHGVLWRMEDPSIDAFLLFKPMVLQSGVLINVWYCLGMPLLFLQHLVLHTLHLGLTLWMNSGQICVKILETKKSSQIFTQFAELVDGVLSGFVAVHKVVDGGDERLVKLCPKMLILCHFFIGLLVPTLILWRMEIVSRQSFFEEVICHGQWSGLHLDSSWIPNTSSIVGM